MPEHAENQRSGMYGYQRIHAGPAVDDLSRNPDTIGGGQGRNG